MRISGYIQLRDSIPHEVIEYLRTIADGRSWTKRALGGQHWKQLDNDPWNRAMLDHKVEIIERGDGPFYHVLHFNNRFVNDNHQVTFIRFLTWVHEYTTTWSLKDIFDDGNGYTIEKRIERTDLGFVWGQQEIRIKTSMDAMREAISGCGH